MCQWHQGRNKNNPGNLNGSGGSGSSSPSNGSDDKSSRFVHALRTTGCELRVDGDCVFQQQKGSSLHS